MKRKVRAWRGEAASPGREKEKRREGNMVSYFVRYRGSRERSAGV